MHDATATPDDLTDATPSAKAEAAAPQRATFLGFGDLGLQAIRTLGLIIVLLSVVVSSGSFLILTR